MSLADPPLEDSPSANLNDSASYNICLVGFPKSTGVQLLSTKDANGELTDKRELLATVLPRCIPHAKFHNFHVYEGNVSNASKRKDSESRTTKDAAPSSTSSNNNMGAQPLEELTELNLTTRNPVQTLSLVPQAQISDLVAPEAGSKLYRESATKTSSSEFAVDEVSPETIISEARRLLGYLQSRISKLSWTHIVLVGYGLGGIIIKQALILANNERMCDILVNRITNIVFLATPHRGKHPAHWRMLLAKLLFDHASTHTTRSSPAQLPSLIYMSLQLSESLSKYVAHMSLHFRLYFVQRFKVTNFLDAGDAYSESEGQNSTGISYRVTDSFSGTFSEYGSASELVVDTGRALDELGIVDINKPRDFRYLEALQDCLGPVSVYGHHLDRLRQNDDNFAIQYSHMSLRKTYHEVLLDVSASNRLFYDVTDWELAELFKTMNKCDLNEHSRPFCGSDDPSAKNPWAKPLNKESSCIISFIGDTTGAGKSDQIRTLELYFRQALMPTVVSLNARNLRSTTNISSEDQISHILRTIVHQLLSQHSIASISKLKMQYISDLCTSRSYKVASWNLPFLWKVLHHALQDLPAAGLVVLFDDLDDWLNDAGPNGSMFFRRFLELLGSLEHGFFVFLSAQSYKAIGAILDDYNSKDSQHRRAHHDPISCTHATQCFDPTNSTTGVFPLYLHIFDAFDATRRVEETNLRFRNLLTKTFESWNSTPAHAGHAAIDSSLREQMLKQLYKWYGSNLRSLVNSLPGNKTEAASAPSTTDSELESQAASTRSNSIIRLKVEHQLLTELPESADDNQSGVKSPSSSGGASERQDSKVKTERTNENWKARVFSLEHCQLLALSFIALGHRPFLIDELTAALGSVYFGLSTVNLVENWTALHRIIKHKIGSSFMLHPSNYYIRFPAKIYDAFLLEFEEHYTKFSGFTAAQERMVPFKLQTHTDLLKHCFQALSDISKNRLQAVPLNTVNTNPAETLYLESESNFPATSDPREYHRQKSVPTRQQLEEERSLFYKRILLSQYKFLGYAANHWFQHYRKASESLHLKGLDTTEIDQLVADNLGRSQFVQTWFEHFQGVPNTSKHEAWRKSIRERFGIFSTGGSASVDGLQVASALGLDRVVVLLLKGKRPKGEVLLNAICSAARNGHEQTVMKLIEEGFKWLQLKAFNSDCCNRSSCQCKSLQARITDRIVTHATWQIALQLLAARNSTEVLSALMSKLSELNSTSFPTVSIKAHLLRTAATAGALNTLELLFNLWKSDLNTIQEFYADSDQFYGQTLLQHAIEGGSMGCIYLVLDYSTKSSLIGINRAINVLKQTPLMMAADLRLNSEDIVRKLLSCNASIEKLDSSRKSPLEYAARSGNLGTLKLLLQNLHGNDQCEPTLLPTGRPKLEFDPQKPPTDAFYAQNPEIVRLLLRCKHISPEAAAHMTVEYGWYDFFKELEKTFGWKDGSYPFSPFERESLLHLAIRRGDLRLVQHLIEKAPSLMLKLDANRAYVPVELASRCGQLSVLRLFMSDTAKNSRFAPRLSKFDIFCLACDAGQYLIVSYFLANGVEISCCSERIADPLRHRWTPIMLASSRGHLEVLQLLLDQLEWYPEAKSLFPNPLGTWSAFSALHVAAKCGQHEAVVMLLENETTNRLCNTLCADDARTPLYHATHNYDITNTLLKYGAQLDHSDCDSKTPIQYEISKGFTSSKEDSRPNNFEVIKLLFDTELQQLEKIFSAEELGTSSGSSALPPAESSSHENSRRSSRSNSITSSNSSSSDRSESHLSDSDWDENLNKKQKRPRYRIPQFHRNAKEAASYAASMGNLDLLKHIYEKLPKLLRDERALDELEQPYFTVRGPDGRKDVETFSTYSAAVEGRSPNVIRWLLSEPQNVPVGRSNPRDTLTEIHRCARLGYDDILSILIFEFRAPPTIPRFGRKNRDHPMLPIFDAAYYAHPYCAATLMRAGASTVPDTPDGITAFDLVPNNADIVQTLVKDPTLDIDLPLASSESEPKTTILMSLSRFGYHRAVSGLIKYGKPNTKLLDSSGRTALHYAVQGAIRFNDRNYRQKVKELKVEESRIPNYIETVKVLVEADAGLINREDMNGITPLEFARNKLEAGNPIRSEIIEILESKMQGT